MKDQDVLHYKHNSMNLFSYPTSSRPNQTLRGVKSGPDFYCPCTDAMKVQPVSHVF